MAHLQTSEDELLECSWMSYLLGCALLLSPAPGVGDPVQQPVPSERVLVVPVSESERERSDEGASPDEQLGPQVPDVELDEGELDWSGQRGWQSAWDAMPSINLGIGLVWHPGDARKVGFDGNILFGATIFQVPFTLWPEVGLNVGSARDRVQLTGVAQLGLGIAAILYYHVGFEGGLTTNGIAYGPRHGPSIRAFQFVGLEFRHKVFFAHMEPGVVRHDLTLNFSVDFGAFIGVATDAWGLW